MSTVKINNLRKAYGAVEVMSNINVEINDQEFVALVGPSGCGKSTLLRMIAGLEDVSGGEIEIDGTVINDVAPKDRNIAMVFQSYALYPHMTVEENIGFALKLAKVPQDEIKQRVMEAAKTLNLTEYLDRFPRQLSGGQRQRVAMGRSIVRNPAVFLFDEPLSNLDARLRVRMRSEIKSLHKRLNATSIYVTHDQIEAMTMADKIIVLRSGKVEQVGAPLDLYDMPVNTFVASFIGSPSINLLHGTVRHQEQGWVCDITDNVYLPIPANIPVTEGQAIYYGIRPEHIQIDHTGQGIEITVENIEPTGNETYILSSIVGQELLFTSNARMSSNGQEKIHITMNITKVHIFDKATEQRLG